MVLLILTHGMTTLKYSSQGTNYGKKVPCNHVLECILLIYVNYGYVIKE